MSKPRPEPVLKPHTLIFQVGTHPSWNVPSTCMSRKVAGTPGKTCFLPRMRFPRSLSSATECAPSRMRSCSCDAISAVASVWFSRSPRARRFCARKPAFKRRCSEFSIVQWRSWEISVTWCRRILASSRGRRRMEEDECQPQMLERYIYGETILHFCHNKQS